MDNKKETSITIPKWAWTKKLDYWYVITNIENAEKYRTVAYDNEAMELYDVFTACDGEDMIEFRTNKEPQKDIEFCLLP